MRYKAGDYVRIKRTIKYGDEINFYGINNTMAGYAGKITKVVHCYYGGYGLKNDLRWIWGEDALEPIKSKDILSIASEIAETNITIKN